MLISPSTATTGDKELVKTLPDFLKLDMTNSVRYSLPSVFISFAHMLACVEMCLCVCVSFYVVCVSVPVYVFVCLYNIPSQVLVSLSIPLHNENTWFRSFKVAPRAEVLVNHKPRGFSYVWLLPFCTCSL